LPGFLTLRAGGLELQHRGDAADDNETDLVSGQNLN
jgi:hypothetical protein